MKKMTFYLTIVGFFASGVNYVDACKDCNCYFSADCRRHHPPQTHCNYDGNISEQTTKCQWRKPKPTNTAAGCTGDTTDSGNCDGLCEPAKGSKCGFEARATLATAVDLWGQAMINVAESGGGLIDPTLAQAALEFPSDPDCAAILARHVGGELVGLAGHGFIVDPPTEPETWEDHHVADLSGNSCLVDALRLVVDGLAAEIQTPGTGDAVIAGIPGLCPEVFDAIVTCPGVSDLICTQESVQTLADALRLEPQPISPDCNENGLEDSCDIAGGRSTDLNEDGIPDECQKQIPTVSEWGLITMMLLMVIVGVIALRRVNRPAAA